MAMAQSALRVDEGTPAPPRRAFIAAPAGCPTLYPEAVLRDQAGSLLGVLPELPDFSLLRELLQPHLRWERKLRERDRVRPAPTIRL